MFWLGFVVLSVASGAARVVNARAKDRGRGAGWAVATVVTILVGAVAGFFTAGWVALARGEAEDELLGAYTLIASLLGAAIVTAPVILLFETVTRRPTGDAGPIVDRRGRGWWWLATAASATLAVVALVSPFAAFSMVRVTNEVWVTEPSLLPDGVVAAAISDHSLGSDVEGPVLVGMGVTLDCAGHAVVSETVGVLLEPGSALKECVVEANGLGVVVGGVDVTISGLELVGVDVGVSVGPGADLDCGGSRIVGADPVVGVAVADGGTVRACQISGFNTGVGLGGSADALVEGVVASQNRIGFYLHSGTMGARIVDSTAEGNEIGFLFESTVTEAKLENNDAINNWGSGFQVGNTTHSEFIGNSVQGGGSGFWLTHAFDNRFEGNTVANSSQWFSVGVEKSSSRNLFIGNQISGGGVGIAVFARAADNQFVENELHNNSKGAHTERSAVASNTFVRNLVYENSHVGLWDDTHNPNARYISNECSRNRDANSVPDGLC